jgi:hypothetical protein
VSYCDLAECSVFVCTFAYVIIPPQVSSSCAGGRAVRCQHVFPSFHGRFEATGFVINTNVAGGLASDGGWCSFQTLQNHPSYPGDHIECRV